MNSHSPMIGVFVCCPVVPNVYAIQMYSAHWSNLFLRHIVTANEWLSLLFFRDLSLSMKLNYVWWFSLRIKESWQISLGRSHFYQILFTANDRLASFLTTQIPWDWTDLLVHVDAPAVTRPFCTLNKQEFIKTLKEPYSEWMEISMVIWYAVFSAVIITIVLKILYSNHITLKKRLKSSKACATTLAAARLKTDNQATVQYWRVTNKY